MVELILAVACLSVLFIVVIGLIARSGNIHIETPEKKAGRLGERFATGIIREILQEEDLLFTNVPVFADGKQTELDNVIINPNGVFIIEVKNLHGTLYGDEASRD